MRHWLFKSEPGAYSIDDLAADQKEWWDGIRNYQARNFMTTDMQPGDGVIFYHSSCPQPAAVGEAIVSAAAIADITQFDPHSPYYDPTATPEKPRWFNVQIAFIQKFRTPLTLTAMRGIPPLQDMRLLAKANRLSILPLTPTHWHTIKTAAQTPSS